MYMCVAGAGTRTRYSWYSIPRIGFFLNYQAEAKKAMAPHSSILAWKIPWMEEPGRLQSMGSLGVGHN